MTREDAEQQSEHWQDIIDEKDALIEQQAKELDELREWKQIILGTGTDQKP